MPSHAWEAANGSSSEEEESDEEVVVAPRRQGGMFRVANTNDATATQNTATPPVNPAEAKSSMLSQIKGMAGERQAHEEVVTVAASTEKSDAEKKALEARQQLIAAQNAAKAAQAAAIQQAALKAAGNQSQQASNQAAEAEAEMRAKQAQAQSQAEAEKKKAEERVAQQRAAQQEALAKAQEAAKKAQAEAIAKAQEAAKKAQADALAKAQAAKQEAEARAKAQQTSTQQKTTVTTTSNQQQTLQQTQQQQQNRTQAEAQARAAQAKAQAEAQSRAMEAKAKAEAEAKTRAQAAQQKQIPPPKVVVPPTAQTKPAVTPTKTAPVPVAAPSKPTTAPTKPSQPIAASKTAIPTAASNGSAKTGVTSTANGVPKTMQQQQGVPQVGISLQRMGQEISQPRVQTTRTAEPVQKVQPPTTAVKSVAQPPQQQTSTSSQQTIVNTQMKPTVQMTRGNVGFDAQAANNATPVPVGHTQLKTPGKVVVPQLQQPQQQGIPIEKPGQTALKQTVKVTEEVLGNEQIRTISNTSANRPVMRADGVAGRFAEQENTPAPLQSVSRGSTLEGAKRWEEERAREAELANMGQQEVPGGVRLNDDSCWQTQRRVPAEMNAPQIGKIVIPELTDAHETQPTVIVRKPAGYEKVKWNEFPDEIQLERQSVPRTKAQEWIPVNNEVSEITRTGFASGKVNKVWPPPADELEKDAGQVNRVKCGDDFGWIQQEQVEVIKSVPRTSRIARAWPPPEDERNTLEVQTSHMPVVQWPPPEFEQMEQEKIEVLAKHIPTKKHERQWPPPPPQYYIPGNENVEQQSSGPITTTSTTTTTTTRVVRAM